jgi:hypothetical protein
MGVLPKLARAHKNSEAEDKQKQDTGDYYLTPGAALLQHIPRRGWAPS